VVEVGGLRYALDLRDLLQANILLDGRWAANIETWFGLLARRARVIIDVGAHMGYYSMLARQAAGAGAQVHAFEPNPRMREQFRRNMQLNGFEDITLSDRAIGDAEGTFRMKVRDFFEPGASGGSAVLADRVLDVRSTTLCRYCDEHGLDHVDLVKIDIEGAEAAALGRYDALVIDLHPHVLTAEQMQTIFTLLTSTGFGIYNIAGTEARRADDPRSLGEEVVAIRHDRLAHLGVDATGDLISAGGVEAGLKAPPGAL
jgi:FkbM family methyltransferase